MLCANCSQQTAFVSPLHPTINLDRCYACLKDAILNSISKTGMSVQSLALILYNSMNYHISSDFLIEFGLDGLNCVTNTDPQERLHYQVSLFVMSNINDIMNTLLNLLVLRSQLIVTHDEPILPFMI